MASNYTNSDLIMASTSTSGSGIFALNGSDIKAIMESRVLMAARQAAKAAKAAQDDEVLSLVSEGDGWCPQVGSRVMPTALKSNESRRERYYDYDVCSRHKESGCKCDGRDNGYDDREDYY